MGSWNETCQLSHLPIVWNDKVKCIILLRNTDEPVAKSYHYNKIYAPLMLPIEGIYDDYGCLENVTDVSDYTLRLMENLQFVDKNDEPYVFSNMIASIKDINRDGVYLAADGCYKKRKLECAYYHKDLYDILVTNMKKRSVYDSDKTFYEVMELKHKHIKELILKYVTLCNEDQTTENVINEGRLYSKLIDDRTLFQSNYAGHQFTHEYVWANVLNQENIDSFISELLDYIMFAYSLEFGRNGYLVTTSEPGDTRDVTVQRLIAEFILSFSQRKWGKDDDQVYWIDEQIICYE